MPVGLKECKFTSQKKLTRIFPIKPAHLESNQSFNPTECLILLPSAPTRRFASLTGLSRTG
jgi:hypothetical protein